MVRRNNINSLLHDTSCSSTLLHLHQSSIRPSVMTDSETNSTVQPAQKTAWTSATRQHGQRPTRELHNGQKLLHDLPYFCFHDQFFEGNGAKVPEGEEPSSASATSAALPSKNYCKTERTAHSWTAQVSHFACLIHLVG